MPYFTHDDVATYLRLALQATGAAQIDALIPAVGSFMETACNRTWNATTPQTETFDGGQRRYFPRKLPIASVASVTVDGTVLVPGTDYYLYDTYLQLSTYAPAKPQTVVIVYTPAETLPEEVKHAMVRWCGQIWQESKDGGKLLQHLTMGPVNATYLAKDGLPQFVQEVISRHRLRPS